MVVSVPWVLTVGTTLLEADQIQSGPFIPAQTPIHQPATLALWSLSIVPGHEKSVATHHGSVLPFSSLYTLEEGQIRSNDVRNTGQWGLAWLPVSGATGQDHRNVHPQSDFVVISLCVFGTGLSVVLAVLDHRDSAISAP